MWNIAKNNYMTTYADMHGISFVSVWLWSWLTPAFYEINFVTSISQLDAKLHLGIAFWVPERWKHYETVRRKQVGIIANIFFEQQLLNEKSHIFLVLGYYFLIVDSAHQFGKIPKWLKCGSYLLHHLCRYTAQAQLMFNPPPPPWWMMPGQP